MREGKLPWRRALGGRIALLCGGGRVVVGGVTAKGGQNDLAGRHAPAGAELVDVGIGAPGTAVQRAELDHGGVRPGQASGAVASGGIGVVALLELAYRYRIRAAG